MEETPPEVKKPRFVLPAWSRYVPAGLISIAVIVHLFVSGWGGYMFAYVKCGIRQPLIASSTDNIKIYYTPENRRYSPPGEGAFFTGYYCAESHAQADGYLRAGP